MTNSMISLFASHSIDLFVLLFFFYHHTNHRRVPACWLSTWWMDLDRCQSPEPPTFLFFLYKTTTTYFVLVGSSCCLAYRWLFDLFASADSRADGICLVPLSLFLHVHSFSYLVIGLDLPICCFDRVPLSLSWRFVRCSPGNTTCRPGITGDE